MNVPRITSLVRRRLLLNYRIRPEALRRILPDGLEPLTVGGWGLGGICLIRLEDVRPAGLPAWMGMSSENAAHRIAVRWTGDDGAPRTGVYILRRDTNRLLNVIAGGRLFPGRQHHARFSVDDHAGRIALHMAARDGGVSILVRATAAEAMPAGSVFGSLQESSEFFAAGSLGYAATDDPHRLDGLRLETRDWSVTPLAVEEVRSSLFDDRRIFPEGSAVFDHGLLMRDLAADWRAVPDLVLPRKRLELRAFATD